MMDPNVYIKYNRLQNELTKKFCHDLTLDPDWSESPLETVMDIGCGPGNTSTYWTDHYFPKIQKLIGVDIDPGMIDLAKKKNTKKNTEYYVADIMKKESLQEWEGRIDRILSTYVFHRVGDQKLAFRNLFDLLRDTGVASIGFLVKGPFYFAFMDLLETNKWKPILEPTNMLYPEAMVKGYVLEFYKQLFEDIGFSVSCCEMRPVIFSYESDEECKNLLLSLHYIGKLSDELKEEYKEDIFRQFVKHSPRDSDGHPTHNAIILHAKLTKKE